MTQVIAINNTGPLSPNQIIHLYSKTWSIFRKTVLLKYKYQEVTWSISKQLEKNGVKKPLQKANWTLKKPGGKEQD